MRVNVIIPDTLFKRSLGLIEQGLFSNFSELVREGLRKEVKEYEDSSGLGKDERKLLLLLREADEVGHLVDEKEMKKHGLKI